MGFNIDASQIVSGVINPHRLPDMTGGGTTEPDWSLGYPTYDARYVNIAGDTLTGTLLLPAANPTNAAQAAHKGYVDAQVATAASKPYVDGGVIPTYQWSTVTTVGDPGRGYMRYSPVNGLVLGQLMFSVYDVNTVPRRVLMELRKNDVIVLSYQADVSRHIKYQLNDGVSITDNEWVRAASAAQFGTSFGWSPANGERIHITIVPQGSIAPA